MERVMEMDEVEAAVIRSLDRAEPIPPVNLRVEMSPYPHLRDDGGCVLARDYIDLGRMAFILAAVEAALQSNKG